MHKIKFLLGNLRASFWFIPSLMVAASIGLALGLIELDAAAGHDWATRWPRLFGAGAAGARGMLSTIAGSMMTVVGVTFSMTLVTLALASSQYTSRILRNFMSDRATQVVLGTFAGIFTYSLVVLRTIRGGDEGEFVPTVAVTMGVVLAVCGVGILIFFVHHIASAIQASNIISSVAEETMRAVDRLFPQKMGDEAGGNHSQSPEQVLRGRVWQGVAAHRNGYIQGVGVQAFLDLAREHHTIVRMEQPIGHFVVEGTTLVSVALNEAPSAGLQDALRDAYAIDCYRTVVQDAAFGIRQIVDMALRALSPGINDTTTAVTCVDYLTAILAKIAARDIPDAHRYESGELRVITLADTFEGLVCASFDQIRESAKGNLAMLLHLLAALETIGRLAASNERRQVLFQHARHVAELAERTVEAPHDLAHFRARLERVRSTLITEPKSLSLAQPATD